MHRIKDALEDARHELATLCGLVAYDVAAPSETFEINTMRCITKIDGVMRDLFNESFDSDTEV